MMNGFKKIKYKVGQQLGMIIRMYGVGVGVGVGVG